MRATLLLVSLALLPFAARAAPPPPPPEFIDNAAQALSADSSAQSFATYSNLFADDLRVFQDGHLLSSDKKSWLSGEQARLGNVERLLIGVAEGYDNVLIVERVDDRSSLPVGPGLLFDARFVTRAVRYGFGDDHLIHEVRIVQGGGYWRLNKGGS